MDNLNNELEAIKEVVRKENQAMIRNDQTTLKEVIASEAVMEHITGVKQSRDEWLNQINKGRMKYYSLEEKDLQVKFEQNRAVVDVKTVLDARVYGFRNKWRLEAVNYLNKVSGQWKIIASKASMY